MLTSRAKTAAANAATNNVKKSSEFRAANRGASSTPASPARMLDSTQAPPATRDALTLLSSTILGLSTTARMRSPRAV